MGREKDKPIGNPNNEDLEITSSRVFNYPRDLLFRAWENASHLSKWWGPKGFTNTFHKFDFKVGGHWSFIMQGPDGRQYPNESIFVEITKPGKIVFDHISNPKFRMTATFEEIPTGTKLNWQMLFETVEVCKAVKGIVVKANEENYDRLEAELTKMG
jgi:uncharacterized protein YndB with AHSA1/START domain